MDKHTPHFKGAKKMIPIKAGYKGLLERLNLKVKRVKINLEVNVKNEQTCEEACIDAEIAFREALASDWGDRYPTIATARQVYKAQSEERRIKNARDKTTNETD